MKRPRAGCPGGRLQPPASRLRFDPQAVRSHSAPTRWGLPMPELAYDFDRRGDIVPVEVIAQPINAECAPFAGLRRGRRNCLRHRVRAPLPAPLAPQPTPSDLTLDRSRDALLTEFGKATLDDRYLLAGESYQDMFARVACAYRRRRRARPAALRLHLPAVVHAGDAGAVERRRRARPADLLLPQRGAGLPRRHRRHLERERLRWPPTAAASAPIGAASAPSARR